MRQDNFYNLYSKDCRYFDRYMIGKSLGRRLKVWDIERNYFQNFQSIATYLFSYEGIENHLQREIEKRMFLYGRCGIVSHLGELTAVTPEPGGEDIYNKPTFFTFCFGGGIPDRSSRPDYRDIGKNGVYAINTFSQFPTSIIVEQYALMLAHVDMSIIAECVNGRFMDVLVAHNNKDSEQAAIFSKKLYEGDLSYIQDKAEEMEISRTARSVSHLGDLLDTKDRLLKDVYALFGIKKIPEKRERMITGEVEISDKMMSFNLKDMLEMRKKMCADIGEVFGRKVSVKCHIDIDASGTLEHEQEMEDEQPEQEEQKNE